MRLRTRRYRPAWILSRRRGSTRLSFPFAANRPHTVVLQMLSSLVAAAQAAALLLLVSRLMPGRRRRPPIDPAPAAARSVSVVLTTLDEAHRVGRCLDGLIAQGPEVAEILVVDSRSGDGTRE